MGLVDKFKELIDLGEDDEFEEDEFDEEELDEADEKLTETRKAVAGAVPFAASAATAKASSAKSSVVSPMEKTASSQRPKLTVHTTKVPELAMEIHVPSNFDQVARIADDLLMNRAAIVNFERVEGPEQRRICDFINGVSYVLDCEARRITDTMILYVPSEVDVATAKPTLAKR